MSVPKGYPSQEKLDRLKAEFSTVEAIRLMQFGLSVVAHEFVRLVASDAVEASSTTSVINATAHVAQRGDVIRITSGALSGVEVKVHEITANTITLGENLPSAPAAAVTFDILRHKYPIVNADGTLPVSITSAPIQFVRDGIDTEVEEDTVVPANNRPLPVKLTGITGDITITAQNLNIQSTHTGANPDSMQIGDGTDLLAITAAGEALVSLTTALPAGNNNIGDVDVVTQPARSHTTDSIRIGDGADLLLITAAGEALVSLTTALPAGGNNIGDVDVLTQPARSHTTDSIRIGDGTDLLLITAAGEALVSLTTSLPAGANNIGDVDVLTQPARSHTTDSIRIGDGTDLLLITAAGEALVSLTTALPTGTNRVGAVDVNLDVVDFIDSTPVLDTSVTNITASAGSPVEIVASLAAAVKKLRVNDTTGKYIGIYTGAAAAEVLQAVSGPGIDGDIEVQMTAGQRVSLRHMANTAISLGEICIQFYG